MLASLAVVVAFSLGAATLPVDATAHAAPPSGGPVGHAVHSAGAAVQSGSGLPGAVDRPLIRRPDRVDTGSLGAIATGAATGAAARMAAPDLTATVPGNLPAAARYPRPIASAGRQHVPVGTTPTTVGSRAPPVR